MKVRRFTQRSVQAPGANTWTLLCPAANDRERIVISVCAGITSSIVWSTTPSTPVASAAMLYAGTGVAIPVTVMDETWGIIVQQELWFAILSVSPSQPELVIMEVFCEDTGDPGAGRSRLWLGDQTPLADQVSAAGQQSAAAENAAAMWRRLKRGQ